MKMIKSETPVLPLPSKSDGQSEVLSGNSHELSSITASGLKFVASAYVQPEQEEKSHKVQSLIVAVGS